MRGRCARRRGRLIVACSGDRELVRGVERMLNMAAQIARERRRELQREREFLVA